jgi:hypothetical protein
MSRVDTFDGQYGTIPDDVYMRKIERANLPEDPMLYENYARKMLADYRPDEPFLASDMARDPADRGGGNHSTERLELRHSGARSSEDPYLPDGTFLDHEFLERDPRGTQNLPDFNEARRQKMARAAFIKFYNDDDHSVPETGINPVQMRDLIRNSQQQFKDRFTNFSESLGAWHNGGTAQVSNKASVLAMTTADGQILDLADATARNRQDAVTKLSNAVPGIPRYTTPDHRVKISRYGMVKPMQDIGSQNWNNNRSNTYLDHQIPVEINGQMVNRMLATMILDIEGQRMNKQVAAQGAAFGDSAVNQAHQAKRNINPEDIFKIIMIGMDSHTQPATSNQHYDGMRVHRSNAKPGDRDVRGMLNQAMVNVQIVESMAQSNRRMEPNKRRDLRENIKTSAVQKGVFYERGNTGRGLSKHRTTDIMREGLDTRFIEESRTVVNYGGVKPMKYRSTQESNDYEEFGKHSLDQKTRVHNYRSKNANTNTNDFEQQMREFRDADIRQLGPADYRGRGVASTEAGGFNDSAGSVDIKASLEQMILE